MTKCADCCNFDLPWPKIVTIQANKRIVTNSNIGDAIPNVAVYENLKRKRKRKLLTNSHIS